MAVKKKVVNRKPKIKNTLNKCLNGNPDIQRVITKAVKIKNADEKLAGNRVPKQADPIAMVYAGHQFGNWVPQLGDGRAVLLGELLDKESRRWDLQLKGSGPTAYSRMGDGKAVLGPVMREYIVSEAMFNLGIPTTRALAFSMTGEMVRRKFMEPGAILTRVASSHIRVGTFQYACLSKDKSDLKSLMDYSINRHYPNLKKDKLFLLVLYDL